MDVAQWASGSPTFLFCGRIGEHPQPGGGAAAEGFGGVEAETVERIRAIADEMLRFDGMELVHLESRRQPGGWVLRLFIDKEGGVTLDDCARASRQLSAHLDVEDLVQHPYTLEVSSPGLDRELYHDRDYTRFAGRRIRLSLYAPVNGRRNFQGRLEGLREGSVVITVDDGKSVTVPKEQVAKARLEPDIQSGRHHS